MCQFHKMYHSLSLHFQIHHSDSLPSIWRSTSWSVLSSSSSSWKPFSPKALSINNWFCQKIDFLGHRYICQKNLFYFSFKHHSIIYYDIHFEINIRQCRGVLQHCCETSTWACQSVPCPMVPSLPFTAIIIEYFCISLSMNPCSMVPSLSSTTIIIISQPFYVESSVGFDYELSHG